MKDTSKFRLFSLAAALSICAVGASAQEWRPVVRLSYPLEMAAGVEFEAARWSSSELRMGVGWRPEDIERGLTGAIVATQRIFVGAFPLDLGGYFGMELSDPDAGLVALPLYGCELGLRFGLLGQSFRAVLGFGFGSARYLERYEGTYFSSMREGRVYEPGLRFALSWRGEGL